MKTTYGFSISFDEQDWLNRQVVESSNDRVPVFPAPNSRVNTNEDQFELDSKLRRY